MGFFGGPVFPLLFMGAITGIAVNSLIPSIPLVVAVPTIAAAVSVAVVPLPLMILVLTTMLFGLSAELAVLPAVGAVTSYVVVNGLGAIPSIITAIRKSD